MRNFRNLNIWLGGINIVKETYRLTKKLPSTEKFGLTNQLQRASVSIPSNIAEGSSRNSEIEFKRFLEIAIGSAFEVETQLIICSELGYINNEETKSIIKELNVLQRQINSLINKILSAKSQ